MKKEAPRRVRFRLLKIVTSDDETYFVRSADLEGARVVGSRFIPICDARGEDLPREPRGRIASIPIEKTKGAKMSWVKVNIVRASPAFTLVEIMVVIALIGILMAIAVPGYLLAHKKNLGQACRDNLQLIENAKRDYISDNDGALPPSDITAANGLRRYFLNGVVPSCPAGGAFSNMTTVGTKCTCSLNYVRVSDDRSDEATLRRRFPFEVNTGGDLSVNGYHDLGY